VTGLKDREQERRKPAAVPGADCGKSTQRNKNTSRHGEKNYPLLWEEFWENGWGVLKNKRQQTIEKRKGQCLARVEIGPK